MRLMLGSIPHDKTFLSFFNIDRYIVWLCNSALNAIGFESNSIKLHYAGNSPTAVGNGKYFPMRKASVNLKKHK